uniref:Methyltransferase FkbM domain-containing protein n=1 Tax=Chromulina nebulosa TaxID=96789 RepID=A0A7S0SXL7_9STRA|mmetsp:Transcript_4799/g.4294  ORF Transcript_4799/g.4294 Transcript_4799/m.4294 type:complete len:373 (+) Transcript_4799:3-1121(+)
MNKQQYLIIIIFILQLVIINYQINARNLIDEIESGPAEDMDPEAPIPILKEEKRQKRDKKKNRKDNTDRNGKQKQSLIDWSMSLTESDYNASDWRYKFRSSSISDYFDQYLIRLSKIFLNNNAIVNFAMIGACDGKTDPTIKYRFLKYPHWRAVFVEPMTINIRDLNIYITENGAANRSHIIQAAVTEKCEDPYILVERPLYEEKDPDTPHWLRRQIGAIVPKGRTTPRSKDWIVEKVECLTPSDVLKSWATSAVVSKKPSKSNNRVTKRRPHVLKIDVEGHDFQVLTGFISPSTPRNELPLLVEFEAKSIAEKFPLAKELLESRGYIVSNFGQDGFAMLKGSEISSFTKQVNEKPSSTVSEINIPDADMYT